MKNRGTGHINRIKNLLLYAPPLNYHSISYLIGFWSAKISRKKQKERHHTTKNAQQMTANALFQKFVF